MLPDRGRDSELYCEQPSPFVLATSSHVKDMGSIPASGILVSEKFGFLKIAIRNSSLSSFKINCLFEISVTKIVLS